MGKWKNYLSQDSCVHLELLGDQPNRCKQAGQSFESIDCILDSFVRRRPTGPTRHFYTFAPSMAISRSATHRILWRQMIDIRFIRSLGLDINLGLPLPGLALHFCLEHECVGFERFINEPNFLASINRPSIDLLFHCLLVLVCD
jgi:hypothetical protein